MPDAIPQHLLCLGHLFSGRRTPGLAAEFCCHVTVHAVERAVPSFLAAFLFVREQIEDYLPGLPFRRGIAGNRAEGHADKAVPEFFPFCGM